MAEPDLLQSWKEIAAYLERSERTCRRWESDYQLPIHRLDGSTGGSVFAYKSELDRWMDRTLHEDTHSPAPKPRLGSRQALTAIAIIAIVSAIALAFMIVTGDRSEPPNPSSPANPTIAILPFTNNTGDEDLDFWEIALPDLLVSDLSQSRYLNVLSLERLFPVLRDLGQLGAENDDPIDPAEVADRARVDNVVVGRFMRVGKRFRISASVNNIPTGASTVLATVEADDEDQILLRIDELTTKIKNHVLSTEDRAGDVSDRMIGTITTSSLEAYRHYAQARASWFGGRVNDAMESAEKAVAIDPNFAMAHVLLVSCYSTLPGYEEDAEASRIRAFEVSDHASPRERYFIQGVFYRGRGDRSLGRALETFEEYASAYPEDYVAVLNLGRIYCWLERWEECIETLESLGVERGFSAHITELRQAYSALGQYDAGLDICEAAESAGITHQYREQLAWNLVYERKFEAAAREVDAMLERAPAQAPMVMLRGDIHLFQAEWARAESSYRELLNPVGSEQRRFRWRLDGLRRLTNLYLAKGQSQRALNVVDQAIDEVTSHGETAWLLVFHFRRASVLFARGDFDGADAELGIVMAEAERRDKVTGTIAALGMRGMIDLQRGNIEGAVWAAEEMRREIDGWLNPNLVRSWHRLRGSIDLAEGNVDDAVAHFEQAVALLPHQHDPKTDAHAHYYSALARAYYLSDDMVNAQQWYEKILWLTSGWATDTDVWVKSHFMLGKIYERRGMKAEAIRSYRTFLDLWQEADFAEVELDDARKSLARLAG
jgi:tetratricopeptide (TPR) repeat protein